MEFIFTTPSLDYYFHTFEEINNLQAGKRPVGVPRLAIYNSFLGHLVRGEVTTMLIRLAPNSMLKAQFKLKGSEKIYIGLYFLI